MPGNCESSEPLDGVIAVATVFWLSGVYLCTLGLVMLIAPRAISLALGAPLLNGFELAGRYTFLLTGALCGLVGRGLWRRDNWARRIAILAAVVGLVQILPGLSVAIMNFRWGLIWPALGALVRMLIVWYLFQAPVREWFAGPAPDPV